MSYLNRANGYQPTGNVNSEPNPRADILDEAKGYVTKDRNTSYGDPEDNFKNIADIWTAQGVQVNGKPVSAADVALMMVGMKLARLKFNPGHKDSWADLIGYGACGWDVASKDHRAKPFSVPESMLREVEPDLAAQVRAAQMRGWQDGDTANVDELAERKRAIDSGWISPNRCQPENPYPHVAHGYDRASSGAALMIANGAHWCDGYVEVGHRVQQSASRPLSEAVAQQARDIETVKGVADKLSRTAVKPRPIRDAPQA